MQIKYDIQDEGVAMEGWWDTLSTPSVKEMIRPFQDHIEWRTKWLESLRKRHVNSTADFLEGCIKMDQDFIDNIRHNPWLADVNSFENAFK